MIRKAVLSDAEDLTEMSKEFFAEAGWSDVTEWDEEKTLASLRGLISSENCIILVSEKDDEITGAIGIMIAPVWFSSGDFLGQELFWYVKPEHRGSVGHKLLLEAESRLVGRAQLCSMFTIDKINDMNGYFLRRGYRPSEHSYIRRIEWQ
jgi:hypothetical protein